MAVVPDDDVDVRRAHILAALRSEPYDVTRDLVRRELDTGHEAYVWCTDSITQALVREEWDAAERFARVLSELRWSSRWFPEPQPDDPVRPAAPDRYLTVDKLRHDVAQFEYLDERGLLPADVRDYIPAYLRIAQRLEDQQVFHQVPLTPADEDDIGAVYNRIVHLRPTPQVAQALSPTWDRQAAQAEYAGKSLGYIAVDDFLTAEALSELRAFCMESTVWAANRYAHGRFGAFFQDGFTCPLLLQIAAEIRAALPGIVRTAYPLRQVWAFKNSKSLPAGSTLHADFAAVNVNIWITPEEANLAPDSGGLEIYDVNAPLWWDFMSYNGRADLMRRLIDDRRGQVVTIPYRTNRAIIFNSDLFHATQGVDFAPGFTNQRINVTFLFGDREDDQDFPQQGAPMPVGDRSSVTGNAWRSRAFSRRRR